jgi:sugar lactone lactonase YvrE
MRNRRLHNFKQGRTRGLLFASLVICFTIIPQRVSRAEPAKVLYQNAGINPGAQFSRPLGIFYDKIRGECYVADTGNNQIVVFDVKGTPIYSFPHRIAADGNTRPGSPTSLVVDRTGRIFLVDLAVDYINVLDPRGRRIQKIHPPEGGGKSERFNRVALGPEDQVYATLVNDTHKIAVIDGSLSIAEVISLDAPSADRSCISSIAVDASKNIYVTDPCAPEMVQIYDPSGKLLRSFGGPDAGHGNFSLPTGIAVMSNGDIWVVDTIRQIASRFSNGGEFLTYIGGRGTAPGAFNFPSALATDGVGRLFVLERAGNRYQCFQLSGSD